jgi:uncharacterized OB-fold protein
MSTTSKPPRGKYVPTTDGLTREFFAHAADGTLHLQQCASCLVFHHPPVWRCTACGSAEVGWTPVSGEGTLFSWTVSHRPFDTAWAAEAPWIVAVVELEEGPRLVGHLAGVDSDALALGQRIVVVPEGVDEGFTFLKMRPLPA